MRPWPQLAATALIGASLAGCDPCTNTPLRSVLSPDGDHVAVVFERSCGATTDFTTQMSILGADDPVPEGGGNAFVAEGLFPFALHWPSSDRVELGFLVAERIHRREDQVDGVRIDYRREKPDPESPDTWVPIWPNPTAPSKVSAARAE